MTLTQELPPDVESRLYELSARSGQKPAEYLIGLVREKLLTPEEILGGLVRSDQEIAAGQWLTLEEMDAATRAPRVGGATSRQ